MAYKRNQIEEAISQVFGEPSVEPSSTLRTRIKRLLDADRAVGRSSRANDPLLASYAFYGAESPGRGADVLFSDYEAFALLLGMQMLSHNWPQSFAVETLRRHRPKLEATYENLLRQDSNTPFEEKKIVRNREPGRLAFDTGSPLFLLIWSDNRYAKDPRAITPSAGIVDEAGAFRILREKAGRSTSWLELTGSARSLRVALSRTRPRQRGRT